jgi:hypothetical protein
MDHALPLPLQQHPSFAAALGLMGRDTTLVDVAGAAPVLTIQRFGLRLASRGPVWADQSSAQSGALRQGRLHLINSDGGDSEVLKRAGFRRITRPQQVAEWSLEGTAEDRMRRLKGKWRNALRRSWDSPQTIRVERFSSTRHMWLLNADLHQQKEKRFRSLPHSFLHAFAAANRKKVLVFLSSLKGGPIAAIVVLIHGAVATYHLGWTSPAGRWHKAHNALLMRAADHLAQRGIARLDLGAVDWNTTPGLARFKAGTGAQIRSLGGGWMRVPLL